MTEQWIRPTEHTTITNEMVVEISSHIIPLLEEEPLSTFDLYNRIHKDGNLIDKLVLQGVLWCLEDEGIIKRASDRCFELNS